MVAMSFMVIITAGAAMAMLDVDGWIVCGFDTHTSTSISESENVSHGHIGNSISMKTKTERDKTVDKVYWVTIIEYNW